MKQFTLAVCLGFLIAGCAQTELAIEPNGIDKMRKSPCACTEIDFTPGTFEWVEAA